MARTPLYQQIAEELRAKIADGVFDKELPAESKLIDEYEVSRNTIRDAIKWLKDLGLVDTQPGRGTMIVERPKPFEITLTPDFEAGFGGGEGSSYIAEVTAQNRSAKASTPKVEIQKPTDRIATELGLNPGTQVISRHQQRFIDEVPWSLQTSYYPLDFVTKGATRLLEAGNIEEGTVRYLDEALGIKQSSYVDRITVRTPDANEVDFFGIPANGSVPVFVTYRTASDTEGSPFRLTISVFPADRNEFLLNVELPSDPP